MVYLQALKLLGERCKLARMPVTVTIQCVTLFKDGKVRVGVWYDDWPSDEIRDLEYYDVKDLERIK